MYKEGPRPVREGDRRLKGMDEKLNSNILILC